MTVGHQADTVEVSVATNQYSEGEIDLWRDVVARGLYLLR
jgi:hypothetical protein